MQKISLFVILSVLLTMPMAFGQEEALGAQIVTLTADNTAYQDCLLYTSDAADE